jgi:hypothetical protein
LVMPMFDIACWGRVVIFCAGARLGLTFTHT